MSGGGLINYNYHRETNESDDEIEFDDWDEEDIDDMDDFFGDILGE